MLGDQRRSLRLSNRVTSVRLEEPFWSTLENMAEDANVPLSNLIAHIDDNRKYLATALGGTGSLASCLRVACLKYSQTSGQNS